MHILCRYVCTCKYNACIIHVQASYTISVWMDIHAYIIHVHFHLVYMHVIHYSLRMFLYVLCMHPYTAPQKNIALQHKTLTCTYHMKKKKPVTSAGYLVRKPSDDLGMALHRSRTKVTKKVSKLRKNH